MRRIKDTLNNSSDKFVYYTIFILMLFFLTFTLRVKDTLGHWPYYAHPDPKNSSFDLHYIIIYLIFWVLGVFVTARLLTLFSSKLDFVKLVLIFLVGWVALIGLGGGEFGGLVFLSSGMVFFIASLLLVAINLLKKRFQLDSVMTSISLTLFWTHNFLDPFNLVEWFLD